MARTPYPPLLRALNSRIPVRSYFPPILFLSCLPISAQIADSPRSPVAVLECEVPELDGFVVHGAVPLPKGYTYDRFPCPFTVYHPDGTPLVTQWEPIAYRADGSLMTIELLAYALRNELAPGTTQEFLVYEQPSSHPALDLDPEHAIFSDLQLRAVDAYGNEYRGDPQFLRIHRFGPVQFTGEWTVRLLPTNENSPSALDQLGAAHLWLSFRRHSNIVEVALNFHNGSSQNPSWHIYFERLQMTIPHQWGAISMWPEPQGGNAYTFHAPNVTLRVLPLIKPSPHSEMHFMEQRHERGFRYWLYPPHRREKAEELSQRKGWAVAIDRIVNPTTQERSWSFHNIDTPGYFPQALPMPNLDRGDSGRVLHGISHFRTDTTQPHPAGTLSCQSDFGNTKGFEIAEVHRFCTKPIRIRAVSTPWGTLRDHFG